METKAAEIVEAQELTVLNTGDIDKKLANVDKAFELLEKLHRYALKKLRPQCVVNMDGKPYIEESGVRLFDGPFGIYERDVKGYVVKEGGMQQKIEDPDAFKGDIICFRYEGTLGSKTLGIEFYFQGGVFLDEIEKKFRSKEDFLFYAEKAHTNWNGRARKKLLGLDNTSWEELREVGITPEKCSNVTHKKSAAALSPEDIEKENKIRAEIATLISEFIVDAKGRSDKLEELTKFKGSDGKDVPGLRDANKLTGKRLEIALGKVRDWHKSQQGGGQ